MGDPAAARERNAARDGQLEVARATAELSDTAPAHERAESSAIESGAAAAATELRRTASEPTVAPRASEFEAAAADPVPNQATPRIEAPQENFEQRSEVAAAMQIEAQRTASERASEHADTGSPERSSSAQEPTPSAANPVLTAALARASARADRGPAPARRTTEFAMPASGSPERTALASPSEALQRRRQVADPLALLAAPLGVEPRTRTDAPRRVERAARPEAVSGLAVEPVAQAPLERREASQRELARGPRTALE